MADSESSMAVARGSRWPALGWATLGALAGASVAPLEPNLLEEGFIVHAAQRIVAGEDLFVDIASFTGPVPYEFLALLFRFFGDSLWVPRVAVVALHALACAAAWAIGRRAGSALAGHAVAACLVAAPVLLFPFFSIYFYVTIAWSLSWIAVYAALRGTRSLRWCFAMGAFVAMIALCKQTLGIALAVALVASTSACAARGARLRAAVAGVSGGLGAALIVVAIYGALGQLGDVFDWLVTVPFSLGETFRAPYMNLWPLGEYGEEIAFGLYVPWLYSATANIFASHTPTWIILLTQLCFALPPLALLGTLAICTRGRWPAVVWIHFASLAALCTNLFPRSDWGHLVFVLPSAAVQLVLIAAGRAATPAARWRAAAATALVATLALGCAAAAARLYEFAEPPRFGPRVPLRPVSHMSRNPALPRVIEYLNERVEPGEPIFVARAEPLLYYATGTSNPTPYPGVIPGIREEQQRAILEGLEHVRYVVMSDIDQPLFLYYRDELPLVQEYLERHFRVPEAFMDRPTDWIIVLERGPDRGPTAIDLFDARQEGRTWVRDAAGARHDAGRAPPRLAVRQNRRALPLWLGPRGGGIDFEIEVPPDAIFQADVGHPFMVDDRNGWDHPARCRMVVSVVADGKRETVGAVRVVNPIVRLGRIVLPDPDPGRHWTPFEVDLRRYAGRRVTLRLEVIPEVRLGPDALGWWGSPRIATAARPDPSEH